MRRGESLFSFKHGDHTCVFYSDLRGLLEVITPYIAEGLRNNERCFCAQKEEVLRALANDLRFLGVDIEHEVKRGALDLHPMKEVYSPNGQFEPPVLMELLERSIAESVRQGFEGFRSAGELSWAIEGRDDCDRLIAYEKLVQASFPGKPAVGICQYPIDRFRPDVLKRVVEAHGKILDNSGAGASTASLRIQSTKCSAEIVTDKFTARPSYQYVIERADGEILEWGTSSDFRGALSSVERLIAAF